MLVKKAKQRYWFRRYVGECAVCGRDASYKEKVMGKKPTDPNLIYIQIPQTATYDYCLERGG